MAEARRASDEVGRGQEMTERLVFVTIKDGPTLPSGRPLRRAVVPVDASTTFEAFQAVVMKKLRVRQVGGFYSKAGARVSAMKDVMMMDDLEVEEIKAEPTAPMTPQRRLPVGGVDVPLPSPVGGSGRRVNSHRRAHSQGNGVSSPGADEDENGKHKSTSRVGTQFNVMLQKVGLKQSPGLPLTADGRDSGSFRRGNSALRKSRKGPGGAVGARKGRGRTNLSLVVGVSMVVCFLTMILLYYSLAGSQGDALPVTGRT